MNQPTTISLDDFLASLPKSEQVAIEERAKEILSEHDRKQAKKKTMEIFVEHKRPDPPLRAFRGRKGKGRV
jgi:hypothetical protein